MINKNLILVILAVCLIPSIFSIGRAISIHNADPAAKAHLFSGIILVYVIGSVVLLSIVASYLIALHNANHKPKAAPRKAPVKHFAKMHSHMKSAFGFLKGIKFADIDDDKASKYIVAIVGIVGLIAILIMLI